MNGFPPQQCVDRGAVLPRELLQFVDPGAPLPLFDGDQGRSGDSDRGRGIGLRNLGGFPRYAQTLSNICRGDFIQRRRHDAWPAQWATNEDVPSEPMKFFQLSFVLTQNVIETGPGFRLGQAACPAQLERAQRHRPRVRGRMSHRGEMIEMQGSGDRVFTHRAGDLLPIERSSGAIFKIFGAQIFPDVSGRGSDSPAACMLRRLSMQAAQTPHCRFL